MRCFVAGKHYIFTRFVKYRSLCFVVSSPKVLIHTRTVVVLSKQTMSEQTLSEESSFKNADGKKMFTKYWKPGDNKPRALVFICHGFGEHCSRYERLGTALAEQGYLAFSHDHVGHGRSEGEKVQVSDVACYVRDVFKHIDQVAADNTEIPLFMFGHSMGGTIAILSVMERPYFFTGAVFSAPSVKADPKVATTCMVFLGKVASRILPSYQAVPPIDPSDMSSDPVQVEKYSSDPLNWHGGMKAKWAKAMLDAMDYIQENVSKLTIPYLLVHGDDDQLVKMEGSHFLHDNSPSTDKTFKVYEGGRHELLNEMEEIASKVHKDILDWIHQRLP